MTRLLHDQILLATVCASEEMNEWCFFFWGTLMLLAYVAALTALGHACCARRTQISRVLWLTLIVSLASIYNVAMEIHVYHIDFIPPGHEGASGPLWHRLRWDIAPAAGACLALLVAWPRHRPAAGSLRQHMP